MDPKSDSVEGNFLHSRGIPACLRDFAHFKLTLGGESEHMPGDHLETFGMTSERQPPPHQPASGWVTAVVHI